jgi:lipopolysaccharide assembly protein B
MLELLFLLLPIAAAYGWYMGRRSALQNKQQEANRLTREYVTGVNFLLSNQQDKAVDLFVDMLKEDSGTIEAHLTLGNLFRSRGEVDRAIRIHQSLLESASLDYEQRLMAIHQLGRDYMTAGLYDRAEEMFNQLTDEVDFRESGYQQLLQIFQLTSEWEKAINIAEKLLRLGKHQVNILIAHFYCELALQALRNDDFSRAQDLLKRAELADKQSARVSIMQGRTFIAKGDDNKAVLALQRVLNQDETMVSETLPLLDDCFARLQQPTDWEQYLKKCTERNTGSHAQIYFAKLIEKREGLEGAQNFMAAQLDKFPSLLGFQHLINYFLENAEQGRARESLLILRNMVAEQLRTKPRYRCEKCGFTANALYWHCPSCRSWSSIKPLRGLEG